MLNRFLILNSAGLESSTPSCQLQPLTCHPSNLWRGHNCGTSGTWRSCEVISLELGVGSWELREGK